MNKKVFAFVLILISTALSGCAVKETQRTLDQQSVETRFTPYSGKKNKIVVGDFSNESVFLRGIFSDGQDRLGSQARTILKTHLQQTQRFNLFDRQNLQVLEQEAGFNNQTQNIKGAQYAIVGGITEFGRKNTSDRQFFGIFGSGKKQFAYSKVMLNVVDVLTSEVIYSSAGAGEVELSTRQVAGFGTRAGYDATLNGKVLDLAVRDAVNNLVNGLENSEWGFK